MVGEPAGQRSLLDPSRSAAKERSHARPPPGSFPRDDGTHEHERTHALGGLVSHRHRHSGSPAVPGHHGVFGKQLEHRACVVGEAAGREPAGAVARPIGSEGAEAACAQVGRHPCPLLRSAGLTVKQEYRRHPQSVADRPGV
jgi:hypothetical protein